MPSAPPAETFLSTSAVHNHPPPQHVVSSRAARRPSGAIYAHLRWHSMQDPTYGLRRISLPRTGVKIVSAVALFHSFGVARQGPWVTWVNKDSSKDRSSYPYSAGRYLLHGSNTPQRCLKRSATALGERLSLGSALVDGGLCLRKPPNVRPVSAHAVGFVAAFESTSPPWP